MRRRRIEKLVTQHLQARQTRQILAIAEELTTKLTHDLHGRERAAAGAGETRFGME